MKTFTYPLSSLASTKIKILTVLKYRFWFLQGFSCRCILLGALFWVGIFLDCFANNAWHCSLAELKAFASLLCQLVVVLVEICLRRLGQLVLFSLTVVDFAQVFRLQFCWTNVVEFVRQSFFHGQI